MTRKIVSQLDRAGHYMGPTAADESPLEPGVWLIPGRCVDAAPPESWPTDKWPRWNGSGWDLIAKPTAAANIDPVAKLQAFLAANPDVVAVLQQGSV